MFDRGTFAVYANRQASAARSALHFAATSARSDSEAREPTPSEVRAERARLEALATSYEDAITILEVTNSDEEALEHTYDLLAELNVETPSDLAADRQRGLAELFKALRERGAEQ